MSSQRSLREQSVRFPIILPLLFCDLELPGCWPVRGSDTLVEDRRNTTSSSADNHRESETIVETNSYETVLQLCIRFLLTSAVPGV